MTAALQVIAAGPGVTLQDGGRHGYLRFGVTGAGPMDPLAHATANRAADAAVDAAAIEVSLGGVELEAESEPLSLAVAGGAFVITLDGRPLPKATRLQLEPGVRLAIRAGAEGPGVTLLSVDKSTSPRRSDRFRRIRAPVSAAWRGARSLRATCCPSVMRFGAMPRSERSWRRGSIVQAMSCG